MISLKDIWKSFDSRDVLQGVSFELAAGEFVGLVGPSGGGKSVLLKIMGNILEPSRGEIVATEPGSNGHHSDVGFLFQEGALFDSMTVLENVAFPLLTCGRRLESKDAEGTGSRRVQALQQAQEMLCEVGLGDAYRKIPGQLSGGMRRRVGIARALVSRPKLVLLDDPTGGLDPVAASVIMNLIRELHTLYRPTVVMVSHDIRRLLPRVDRVLALFDGTIVCDMKPAELRAAAPENVIQFLATRFEFDSFRPHDGQPPVTSPIRT